MGMDTNLVTSAAASWSHSGARRRRADAASAAAGRGSSCARRREGDEAFAERVAEAHGAWRAAASARGDGAGGGAGAREGEPPGLTAVDVLRTLANLAHT